MNLLANTTAPIGETATEVISVVIPTLSRQASLKRAINSVLAQRLPADVRLEIIVIDNSDDANSRTLVESLSHLSSPIKWLHETAKGVANARNTGVNAANGKWIAFLDDDESASDVWLGSLLAVARSVGADAVFGPISAEADGGIIGPFAPYFCREIDRVDAQDITDLAAYLGTNNSMFLKQRCFTDGLPFDLSLNAIGGEDSLFLKRLVKGGRKFAWASDARVVEWVSPKRLNWAYVRQRKFLSGQIRVFVYHMMKPVKWPRVAWWMSVGLAQCTIAGASALVLRLVNPIAAERARVVFSSGLGKVLWMPRFRPRLYGSGHVT